jgi:cell division protein FtsB
VGAALTEGFQVTRHLLLPPNPPLAHQEAAPLVSDKFLNFAYTGRRKFATAAAGLLVCIVAYHVVFGANGLTAYEAKRHENKQLAQQIESLKSENAQLAEHNARLQTDRGAIEESIRTQLHFTKPDEVVLTVPDAPASPAAAK